LIFCPKLLFEGFHVEKVLVEKESYEIGYLSTRTLPAMHIAADLSNQSQSDYRIPKFFPRAV